MVSEPTGDDLTDAQALELHRRVQHVLVLLGQHTWKNETQRSSFPQTLVLLVAFVPHVINHFWK